MTDDRMSKSERNELAALLRRREKLAKADVDRVAAERLVDFEASMAEQFDARDEVRRETVERLEQDVLALNERIADEIEARGVPRRSPTAHVAWLSRGENITAERRAELRKVATTRIAAEAKLAKVAVERASVDLQGELVAGGLESGEARSFLERMPKADALLPRLDVAELDATTPAGRRLYR